MKKILILIMMIFLNIQTVNASSIGCVKFNVDTYKDGYPGGIVVTLHNKKNNSDSVSFDMDEYGNEWSYFVEPGEYYITVSNKHKKDYDVVFNEESFLLNGDDDYTCDITVTKKEEASTDEEDENVEDLNHVYHYDKNNKSNRKNKSKKSDSNKEVKQSEENKEDGTSSILPVVLIGGLVALAICLLLLLIRIKRK